MFDNNYTLFERLLKIFIITDVYAIAYVKINKRKKNSSCNFNVIKQIIEGQYPLIFPGILFVT